MVLKEMYLDRVVPNLPGPSHALELRKGPAVAWIKAPMSQGGHPAGTLFSQTSLFHPGDLKS